MKNLYFLFLVSFLFLMESCTKDFEELNTNPNAPIEVEPSFLLRQVLWDFAEQMSYEGFVAGNLLAQHSTAIDFNLFDRHSLSEPQFGGNPWPFIYKNLRDNEIMLEQARSIPAKNSYLAPALILKAYMTASLTDIYGDVPYYEALKGTIGNTQPAYDSQEDIYLGEGGILENLNNAIEILNSDLVSENLGIDGDILFNGNKNSWIKFGNSLRLKYLIRISDRVDSSIDLQSIYDSGQFITNNFENASFDFSSGQPNNFRMANLRDGDFNLFILSETGEEILKELIDPRISILYRGTSNNATEFKGLLNGPDASITSISVADYSLAGTVFRENTGELDANYMTAWETHFLLAEAAEKGMIAADPKDLYELGIVQAFEYWNTNLPETYLSTEPVAYAENGVDPLKQIITQKWIASHSNGYEAWIEFRRTGFPELKTISASLNNNLIPVRMPYPTDEAALNSVNFNSATAINSNSINSPVWWDAN